MFSKILIANRGEIACRVIKTARRLGIATVAVYSDADAGARHVDLADEAYPIGPAPARESYLVGAKIIEAAQCAGAQAIHPGYGFLSENAGFAEACAAAGLIFIGPPPSAIRAMGSKSAAKALMAQSGVPLVPGYHDDDQDPALLAAKAAEIGYPVLIKASAGGGGKGMRVVETPEEFASSLESAKREAKAGFGDDQVLIEKYLTRPRHIEIQVFADTHGNIVSLFERDCSIQRRHQKVVEEAPAIGIDPGRRYRMGEAACAAASAIGYVGAGTVEFIAEGESFYFMEMNTRLQVEHPVTELVTGQDLVEWQLRVASGERLPLGQDKLSITGHAIEVRIYAEDPAKGFLPSIGTLKHLIPPAEGPHVRVDTGVRQGDAISIHYDPMIAKLIVWDRDRAAAIGRLRAALAAYEIAGVSTNLEFLAAIAAHPAYQAGELDTGFIGRHGEALLPPKPPVPAAALAAAALRLLEDRCAAVAAAAARSGDPWSPWNLQTAWRLNGDGYQDLVFETGEGPVVLRAHPQGSGYRLDLPGRTVTLARAGEGRVAIDGAVTHASVLRDGEGFTVFAGGTQYRLTLVDPLAPSRLAVVSGGRLTAPMPGKITQILASAGSAVRRGAALMVLEAMKMEHTIAAPADGTVTEIRGAVGDLVDEGAELVVFASDPI